MRTEPPTTLDGRRLRSFIGLVLSRLGPRAHSAVSGVFLALLVGEQTESLFLVTVALTLHRFVTWLAYPIAGRISDHSTTPIGRRTPYMAAGLLLLGVFTAMYTRADSYWVLVALLVGARLVQVVYRVPSMAVTPEAFGSSRWLRAGLAIGIGGLVVGVSIRVTVIATWDQSDPSTWGPAYYLAAAYIVFAALAVLVLVRELPSATKLAQRERVHILAPMRSMFTAPNAGVLFSGLLLSVAAGGAFERAFPIYARDQLGAGGSELAIASLVQGPAEILVVLPVGWWLASRVNRRTAAVLAGLTGAAAAVAHLWVTHLWQSIVLGLASSIFFVAVAIALIPLYLQIVPRHGGLAERVGVLLAPLIIVGMVASYISGLAVDATDGFAVMWLITAGLALAGGFVMLGLRLPPGHERANTRRMWRVLGAILWGKGEERRLFRGDVHDGDVDGAAFIEGLQAALDPYTDDVRWRREDAQGRVGPGQPDRR